MPIRHFTSLRGRYWDRTSDHIDHVPQLVEIPTWFECYTNEQTFWEIKQVDLPRFESKESSRFTPFVLEIMRQDVRRPVGLGE